VCAYLLFWLRIQVCNALQCLCGSNCAARWTHQCLVYNSPFKCWERNCLMPPRLQFWAHLLYSNLAGTPKQAYKSIHRCIEISKSY
jgi:hypothetical protein